VRADAEFWALLLPLVERFEGFRARPYLCPAGVATIGFGTTRYLDGSPVRLTDAPITRDHARILAREQILRDYLPGVLRCCPAVDAVGLLAALVDFAYNLGIGQLRASTLRRRVNAGHLEDVPAELRRWVRGGGCVLPGLVKRRDAEARLI